jgi:hypothetical protein
MGTVRQTQYFPQNADNQFVRLMSSQQTLLWISSIVFRCIFFRSMVPRLRRPPSNRDSFNCQLVYVPELTLDPCSMLCGLTDVPINEEMLASVSKMDAGCGESGAIMSVFGSNGDKVINEVTNSCLEETLSCLKTTCIMKYVFEVNRRFLKHESLGSTIVRQRPKRDLANVDDSCFTSGNKLKYVLRR